MTAKLHAQTARRTAGTQFAAGAAEGIVRAICPNSTESSSGGAKIRAAGDSPKRLPRFTNGANGAKNLSEAANQICVANVCAVAAKSQREQRGRQCEPRRLPEMGGQGGEHATTF